MKKDWQSLSDWKKTQLLGYVLRIHANKGSKKDLTCVLKKLYKENVCHLRYESTFMKSNLYRLDIIKGFYKDLNEFMECDECGKSYLVSTNHEWDAIHSYEKEITKIRLEQNKRINNRNKNLYYFIYFLIVTIFALLITIYLS